MNHFVSQPRGLLGRGYLNKNIRGDLKLGGFQTGLERLFISSHCGHGGDETGLAQYALSQCVSSPQLKTAVSSFFKYEIEVRTLRIAEYSNSNILIFL